MYRYIISLNIFRNYKDIMSFKKLIFNNSYQQRLPFNDNGIVVN